MQCNLLISFQYFEIFDSIFISESTFYSCTISLYSISRWAPDVSVGSPLVVKQEEEKKKGGYGMEQPLKIKNALYPQIG